MLMSRIDGATRELGKPKDWPADKPCMTLPVRDMNVNGEHVMASAWQPEPDEVARISNGASVRLWVLGGAHPPVALDVGAAPDVESFKGIMHYDELDGALLSDTEIPGVTRIQGPGKFFVGESFTALGARAVALAMGFAFKEKA
jgi:hypothetical protein